VNAVFLLGITGGSGSGTTTVGELLTKYGFFFINADNVYHNLLENDQPLKERIFSAFCGVRTSDGSVDRRALAKLVFLDTDKLKLLNSITHGAVIKQIKAMMPASGPVAVEAVALYESGMAEECDFVLGVTCDPKVRVERIMSRDGISEEEAYTRINAQHGDDFYVLNCNSVIDNSGSPERLGKKIGSLVRELKKRYDF